MLGYAECMSEHDTSHLQELGRRRRKLVAQLEALDAELTPEVFAAAQAEVPQKQIIEWTGMARESIRLKSMTPEQREAERAKRRK
jgi:predicted mannosyl-3-phosphoglycerate phosphatase (HAD superfamily)